MQRRYSAEPTADRNHPIFINHEYDRGRGPISDQPTSQLPATIQQAEVTVDQRALNVVPALIADLGDEAALALCRILHRQHPQPEHAPGLRARLQPVLRLVRGPRPDAGGDPAA